MQDDSQDCIEMNRKDPEDFSHQNGHANQLETHSGHEGTQRGNNYAQNKDRQLNGNGMHNIDLGIAKKENIPEPLQACTSFRTSNTSPNGLACPTCSKVNTNGSVGNSLRFPRTDHDCSVAEPDVRDVHEENVRSRRNAASGASRCYKAVRLAFLQCLEETPIVVPGLVLIILFCVTIIVLIAVVSQEVIILIIC